MMRNEIVTQVDSRNNYINVRVVIIATVIGLLNSFYYGNIAIMGGLCALEVAVLIFFFVRRDYISYISYFMIFLCFSMESEIFVGTSQFYGFKNFRIAGLNIAAWMLMPIALMAILNYKTIFRNAGTLHRSILRKLIFFSLFGFIMGFFTYLSNDNGFSNMPGSFSALFSSYYSYILPLLELFAVSWVLVREPERLQKIKVYLFSVIPALAIVMITCLFMKNYGNRGGLPSLQISDIYFLLVSTLILVAYDHFDKASKLCIIISGAIILILSLMYNTSGKIVIITVLIPIAMVVLMIRKRSGVKTILMVIVAVVLLILLSNFIFPLLMKNSQLLTVKYQQARRMFSFGGGNWLENMPESPKMRITEFLNIFAEYVRKPWFSILGKGFCGTIRDNLNLFSNLSSFAFSNWELQLGAYYTVHESINCFFLVGGIYGIYVIISVIIQLFRNVHKSPWLLFGFMWVLLFYNYHFSIAIYGVVALIVGFVDCSNIDEYRSC